MCWTQAPSQHHHAGGEGVVAFLGLWGGFRQRGHRGDLRGSGQTALLLVMGVAGVAGWQAGSVCPALKCFPVPRLQRPGQEALAHLPHPLHLRPLQDHHGLAGSI